MRLCVIVHIYPDLYRCIILETWHCFKLSFLLIYLSWATLKQTILLLGINDRVTYTVTPFRSDCLFIQCGRSIQVIRGIIDVTRLLICKAAGRNKTKRGNIQFFYLSYLSGLTVYFIQL